MKKILLVISFVCIMLLSSTVIGEIDGSGNVIIKDLELNRRLLSSFDTDRNGKISIAEAEKAIYLYIGSDGKNITSLDGIEHFKNLQIFSFHATNVEDISPLKDLKCLEFLQVHDIDDYDLSLISDLTNLKTLRLGDNTWNTITDISSLGKLVNLEYLTLGFKKISDISPLKNMTKLKHLELGLNNIEDISVLTYLINLERLELHNNNISNIDSLNALENLEFLSLSYNDIEDLSAIKNLTNLTTLMVDDNKIVDVSVLKDFYQLSTLSLRNNFIQDISPLSGIAKAMDPWMGYLDLINNPINNKNTPNAIHYSELDFQGTMDYYEVWIVEEVIEEYQLDITSLNGSVINKNKKNVYLEGDVVSLEAIADIGYEFKGWIINGEFSEKLSNTLQITIEGDYIVEAIFEEVEYVITLTYENAEIEGLKKAYKYGETVTLTVKPYNGYLFDNWYMNMQVFLEETLTFVIKENCEIVVNVEPITYINDSIELTNSDFLNAVISNFNGTMKYNYGSSINPLPNLILEGDDFKLDYAEEYKYGDNKYFIEYLVQSEDTSGELVVKKVELEDLGLWDGLRFNINLEDMYFASSTIQFNEMVTLETFNIVEDTMSIETTDSIERPIKISFANLIIEETWGDSLDTKYHKLPVVYIESDVDYYQVDFIYPGKARPSKYIDFDVQLIDYGMSNNSDAIKNLVEFGQYTIGKAKHIKYSINDPAIEANKKIILKNILMGLYTLGSDGKTNYASKEISNNFYETFVLNSIDKAVAISKINSFFRGTNIGGIISNPSSELSVIVDNIDRKISGSYFYIDEVILSKISTAKDGYEIGKRVYSFYASLSNNNNFKYYGNILKDMAVPLRSNGIFYQSGDQTLDANIQTLQQVKDFDIYKEWPDYNINNISTRLDHEFYNNSKVLKKVKGEDMIRKEVVMKMYVMHSNALSIYSNEIYKDKMYFIREGGIMITEVYEYLINNLPVK